ncbi:MAG: two-component system response regulator [Clostridiales bacterium 43-6]|nr:MAG: two-component system response regulator [Clostridiales bacterium 43-6]
MEKVIMIVDDAAFMRMMIKNILSKTYKIIEAENGREAIEKYESSCPDLVLMDIAMPGMDGIEALREIKDRDKNAKVVICSSVRQEAIVLEAIQSGAVDYIVKPFQAERLIQTIDKFFN